jgi:hypothetical protein
MDSLLIPSGIVLISVELIGLPLFPLVVVSHIKTVIAAASAAWRIFAPATEVHILFLDSRLVGHGHVHIVWGFLFSGEEEGSCEEQHGEHGEHG